VAAGFLVQIPTEVWGIYDVAVVGETQAIGTVDIEGLVSVLEQEK
jgi:hypothetical protein